MDVQDGGGSNCKRVTWTNMQDKCFVDLMLEHTLNGQRDGTSFTKVAWNNMHTRFNRETNLKYDVQNLKNRFKTLRKLYQRVHTLSNSAGFGWDSAKKCVVAHEERYWTELLTKDPEAAKLQHKHFPHQEALHIIFGSSTAMIQHSGSIERQSADVGDADADDNDKREMTATEAPKSLLDSQATFANPAPAPNTSQSDDATQVSDDDDVPASNRRGKHPSSGASSSRCGKRGRWRRVNEAVAAMKVLADAFVRRAALKEKAIAQKAESLDECMKVLGQMEGLEKDLYLKAISVFRDDYNRLAFLRMSPDLRLDWLGFVCGGDTQ